ncbi:sensor histidine kinase [Cesiribacter sp. SM1]|uniref:sensor histidine kinase n=1 Tax=Cesiribacter sp. SM1 TaxID=2861196 RepID=UPI001CD663FF|nr:histidine kinase [Cesiribacter sp. SM1]
MKDLINKSAGFNRIEFWAATTIFVFIVFFFITEGIDDVSNIRTPNRWYFEQARIPFYYYQHYFFPQLIRYTFLFLAFLLLNFMVVPQLLKGQSLARNIFLIIATLVAGGFVFGVTDTYLKNYLFENFSTEQEAYNSFFQNSFLYAFWLLLMFGLYSVIKYLGVYLLSNAEAIQQKYSFVTHAGLAAIVLWMISVFLLLVGDADGEFIVGWGMVFLSGILLYWYSIYTLIPESLGKKKPFLYYLGRAALVMLIAFLPISFLVLLFLHHAEAGFGFSLFNVAFQLLITAPLSWVLFKRQMQGKEEVFVLKKELGRSNANFDFLRSQINPHFLFNALNTIYGTAIQEKAERTSEGIERLGDMMRFMLQENMQEKISLAREIEYLNNYISLQKLRTDPNPNVQIQAEIEQPLIQKQIAPMLLIPFVENAFKHGISFREPSHIKVGLELRDSTLYFDVYNSRHQKKENDPEKDKSGIGLVNVKQRLQLLYPGRHELIIRETGKEFFVHLTIQLL